MRQSDGLHAGGSRHRAGFHQYDGLSCDPAVPRDRAGQARRYGVQVIGTEVVGLCPMKALVDCAEYYLQIEDFDFDAQVLENYIL